MLTFDSTLKSPNGEYMWEEKFFKGNKINNSRAHRNNYDMNKNIRMGKSISTNKERNNKGKDWPSIT